jgi:hypothetical protein
MLGIGFGEVALVEKSLFDPNVVTKSFGSTKPAVKFANVKAVGTACEYELVLCLRNRIFLFWYGLGPYILSCKERAVFPH